VAVLAVGVFSVADGKDMYCFWASSVEEETIIPAAEPQAGQRRLETFYITGAAGEVAIQAVQDLQGGLAVDCP
jgi:hypothetical protein